MERAAWLKAMREDCQHKYDTVWAPGYGEKWGLYPNATHLLFLQQFLDLLPPAAALLDAACGAGRYLPYLLEGGHTVLGIDQSQGMLGKARYYFPHVPFEQLGMQEMAFQSAFDGTICMDAMENLPPEDWSLVLGNFHRALKPGGVFYFTAETIENADEAEIRQAFLKAQQAGLPVVYGEWPDEEVYHFHPTNPQVRDWVRQVGFQILHDGDGDQYFHLIARRVQD